MLAIARTLMAEPSVLLLVEPAPGPAPSVVAELMRAVQQVVDDGGAVIIAEPSTSILRVHIDRGYIVQRGKAVAQIYGDGLAKQFRLSPGSDPACVHPARRRPPPVISPAVAQSTG